MDSENKVIREILGRISATYQNFQVNEYSVEIWKDGFKGYSFGEIKMALLEHVKISCFPPTIADLLKFADAVRSEKYRRASQDKARVNFDNNQNKLLQFPPEKLEENRQRAKAILQDCLAGLSAKKGAK